MPTRSADVREEGQLPPSLPEFMPVVADRMRSGAYARVYDEPELTPVAAHRPKVNLGLLRSGGVCAFGRWQGTIRFDGREMRIRDLAGWAEEFSHRW